MRLLVLSFFLIPYKVFFLIEKYTYLLYFKFNYDDPRIIKEGSGGAHKYIITIKNKSYFVKKFGFTSIFWHWVNLNFNPNMPKIVPTVYEKLNSVSKIKESPLLQSFCDIIKVDYKKREIWTTYFSNYVDADFSQKKDAFECKKILNIFIKHGFSSCDHEDSNFLKNAQSYKIIDVDSFFHEQY